MIIHVNITDRQMDGQTDKQTHQSFSSEPNNRKEEGGLK